MDGIHHPFVIMSLERHTLLQWIKSFKTATYFCLMFAVVYSMPKSFTKNSIAASIAASTSSWAHSCGFVHHLAAATLPGARHGKLGPKYYGPYRILSKINEIAYQLDLPKSARLHDVFHVNLLKKYEGIPLEAPPPLPPLLHGRVVPTPATVLHACLSRDQ